MCALVRYLRRDISPSGRLGSGTVSVIAIPLALGRAAARAMEATNGPAVQSLTWTPTTVDFLILQKRRPTAKFFGFWKTRNASLSTTRQ
jgi:hypothetical protein